MADDALTRKEAEMGRLLPCPFCGDKAIHVRATFPQMADYVMCFHCNNSTAMCDSQEQAAKLWNRRALSLESVREEALEARIKEIEKDYRWLLVNAETESRNAALEEAAKMCHEAALQLRAMADGQRMANHGSAAADTESKVATAEVLERALRALQHAPARVAEGETPRGLSLDRDGDPLHEAPAKEQPREPSREESKQDWDAALSNGKAAPDVAAMVERLRGVALGIRGGGPYLLQADLLEEAAALIEKLG